MAALIVLAVLAYVALVALVIRRRRRRSQAGKNVIDLTDTEPAPGPDEARANRQEPQHRKHDDGP
jgi:hypothetical protein